MKKISIVVVAPFIFSAVAYAADCKSKAMQVARAIDKVYVPKLAKGTKISIINQNESADTENWLVNFLVPNAGGQTAYEIQMTKGSCTIENLSQFSE